MFGTTLCPWDAQVVQGSILKMKDAKQVSPPSRPRNGFFKNQHSFRSAISRLTSSSLDEVQRFDGARPNGESAAGGPSC